MRHRVLGQSFFGQSFLRQFFGCSIVGWVAMAAGVAQAQGTPSSDAMAWSTRHIAESHGDHSNHADSCQDHGCGKSHMLALRAAQGKIIDDGVPNPFATREAFGATDLLTVDLDIDVDPAATTIAGSNEMRVRSLVNGLTQFTFMLRSNYTITQTQINGVVRPNPSAPPANSYARTLTLDRAYNAGEEFTVKVFYNGTAVSRGFGSIEFQQQNGVPIIATLSEAYYAATWWPVKDGDVFQPGDNGDKSIGRLAITVPSTLKAVSNGLLEGTDTIAGGKTRYRWRTNYPTSTYLYAFAATNYNQWSVNYTYPLAGGGNGTMPVQFSIYPASDTPQNRAAWERVLPMFPAFRGVFGEYPFINEKYGIYQFPFGGGMEHQTYTGQGTFNESVTAHELAHQWWGDNVTCKTWNHIWLNEGFATYGEALWEERKPGSSGLPALHAAMNARRPSATDDTVYVPDASVANMNRIFSSTFSYRKGGWAMHQLRKVVGDANFFTGLQNYRAAFQGSGATTDDFKAVMSATSGKNLNNFFDQWIYGIGAPSYAFGWQNRTIGTQNYLALSVRQTQPTNFGVVPAGGVFFMPIDIRVDRPGGTGTQTITIENAARTQHFLLPISAPATGVALDEFNWIFSDAKVAEAYVNGPVKVVSATPAPLSQTVASLVATPITIQFSEAVTAAPSSVTLTGPSGNVGFAWSLTSANTRGVLTPAAPLLPGSYTLTLGTAISTTASGLALDGEVTAGVLPSGDGIPGGAASWTFQILPVGNVCDTIDFNRDTLFPDSQDLDDFLAVLSGGPGACSNAPNCGDIDFNNDGLFPDSTDLDALISRLGGGPCL
jgi:aminopeptidase N